MVATANLILAGLRSFRGYDTVQHSMGFCGPCVLLPTSDKRRDKGMLVNKPFSNWVKLSDVLKIHSKYFYHRVALQSTDVLKSTIENPSSRLDVMVSSALRTRIAENKHILHQIVRAVIFFAILRR